MTVKFGIPEDHKTISGTEIYIRILQISALLPIPYFFAVVGYPAIITKANVLSFLFDTGMMTIPRFWSLLLSLAYRITSSEVLVCALLLIPAFVCGLIFKKLLRDNRKTALNTRRVLAVLIILDLIVRLIPLGFNQVFGLPSMIIGFVVRAACLCLVLLDLLKDRKSR